MDVPAVPFKELSGAEPGEDSATIRSRVIAARQIQAQRFAGFPGILCNAYMPPKLMREHCKLDPHCYRLLEQTMNQLNFSARAHDRILKVARTLADLGGSEMIREDDLYEAIQYRTLDRKLWA